MAPIWRRNWSTRGKFILYPSRKNPGLTQRALTSLQCGRQIAQLKEEYEETKRILEAEAAKLRQVGLDEILRGINVWRCSGGGDLQASVFVIPPECPERAERRRSAGGGGGCRAPHGGRPPARRSGFKRYGRSSCVWLTADGIVSAQRRLYGPFNAPHSVADEMGKPGSDAGMPAIEDSEVGKLEENQFGK